MRCGPRVILSLFLLSALSGGLATAQTAQVGAEKESASTAKIRVDYVHYRPARWENRLVKEAESEITNQGGLLYFYLTNISSAPVDLRFWRMNNHDESYWLLNHFVAWHRLTRNTIQPGESTVLEVNGISRDFGIEAPFTFEFVDSTWEPCVAYEGRLKEDPVCVSYIRVFPDLQILEVHFRNAGEHGVSFSEIGVLGHEVADVSWRGRQLKGKGNAIARVRLSSPVKPSTLLVIKAGVTDSDGARNIFAHRRAFPDYFPIGTWNTEPETEAFFSFLRQDHVDTLIKSGKKDDPYFSDVAQRYGFRTMTHTGVVADVDMLRDLGDHPSIACWMLQDEPDWSQDPHMLLLADMTVRRYNTTVPTFINLCRNIKFFEYAPIADIAGHDHYCVTAPSSSLWPEPYGTRLEETAYYTRDLKYASEPRPIWVWSQGNADGWEERPKRPVPTGEEIAAQLVLNLGRGAKGILWFTYHQGMSLKYPDTREAMRGWNRVMAVMREEFLSSEPAELSITAPKKMDVVSLVSWDNLIVLLTNTDYDIHPEAYQFRKQKNVRVSIPLPEWITPKAAFAIGPNGIHAVSMSIGDGKAKLLLPRVPVTEVIVLANDSATMKTGEERFREVLGAENLK